MDELTSLFYNKNADILQEKYNSSFPDYINLFNEFFQLGTTVLDIGSGSGRDLNILMNQGFDAYGLEPSENMIQTSIKQYKDLTNRVLIGSLPNSIPFNVSTRLWNNILASSVLQHIPDSDIYKSIIAINNLLKSDGILIISVPTEYPEIINNRDKDGRQFYIRSKGEYIQLFKDMGFKLEYESVNNDALNRDNTVWTTLILKK